MSFKQIGCIKTYVGIDPGANGGISINRGGEVFLHKMPKTTLEFADLLKAFHVGSTLVVIEKVGVRPDDVAVTDGILLKIFCICLKSANTIQNQTGDMFAHTRKANAS